MTNKQTIDGVSRELSVPITLTGQQERDILRFYDTCEDGQGYDVPKDRMKSLARLGLIRPTGFSRYEITDAGDAVIDKLRALLDAPVNPLSEIEVLRSVVKELEALRDARVDAKLAAQPQGEADLRLQCGGMELTIWELQQQMADRDALLDRWLGMFDGGIASSMLGVLRESTRAALSATKEGKGDE